MRQHMNRYAAITLVPIALLACDAKHRMNDNVMTDVVSSPTREPISIVFERDNTCPTGMVEVEGDYCTRVEEVCLRWVTNDGQVTKAAIPRDGQSGRCGEWRRPTKCVGKRVHMQYCIDTYEFPNAEDQRPQSWMSWYDAKNSCESEGKRLCTSSEWTFAAEGPDMHPYPYGDGYTRDKTLCNIDNHKPHGLDVFSARKHTDKAAIALDMMLVKSGQMSGCVSDFGVHDLAGNLDELVVNESGRPYVSGLKGGHVFGVRNASRPMTTAHGPTFSWYESGSRCCFSPTNGK